MSVSVNTRATGGLGDISSLTAVQAATLSNVDAKRLPRTRLKLGCIQAQTPPGSAALFGNLKILVIGDSIEQGQSSNGAGSGDFVTYNWISQLTRLLNKNGIPASSNGFLGAGFSGFNAAQYDPRIVMTGNFGNAGAGFGLSIGGVPYVAQSAASFSYTPSANMAPDANVDTFDIYYQSSFIGANSFNINLNGGANTLISVSDTSTKLFKATITGTLGSNTLNISWVSGTVIIQGISAYNSAQNQVQIINGGWNSGSSANYATQGFPASPGSVANWTLIAPDLTILKQTINDSAQNFTTAQSVANGQIIINNGLSTGDVLLETLTPGPSATVSVAAQLLTLEASNVLASSNNLAQINMYDRAQSYALWSPFSYQGTSVHPNQSGYADIARAFNKVFLSI